jgi:hypothetical protein
LIAHEPARQRPRPSPTRDARNRDARAKLLEAAVRIESAAELEPVVAGEGLVADEPRGILRSDPESGRTSEPEAAPAWRRSDLEDFLL